MYLSDFNKFRISEESLEALKDTKKPKDLEFICQDLKVCGRKEFSDMLKMRLSYVNAIDAKNRTENEKKRAELDAARTPKTEE